MSEEKDTGYYTGNNGKMKKIIIFCLLILCMCCASDMDQINYIKNKYEGCRIEKVGQADMHLFVVKTIDNQIRVIQCYGIKLENLIYWDSLAFYIDCNRIE